VSRVTLLLTTWIQRQSTSDAFAWLESRLGEARAGEVKGLNLGFSMAPRKLGKLDLALSEADLQAAQAVRTGWDPRGWSVDQAARALLVISLPARERTAYVATLDRLFAAAEMGEAVALYQALPLLPHPEAHHFRCTEGIRTNIKAVFCAIAHRNPYPAEHLTEDEWNQLVMKALFVGAALDPIAGLEKRVNPALARMLIGLAHERRAAHRPIPPELWRGVGPFADDAMLAELEQVLATGSDIEQQAAALAVSSSPHPKAKAMLAVRDDLRARIASGDITWAKIAAGR
jgi:hypothetical protein